MITGAQEIYRLCLPVLMERQQFFNESEAESMDHARHEVLSVLQIQTEALLNEIVTHPELMDDSYAEEAMEEYKSTRYVEDEE